jgi:hypothetical protein
MDKYKELRKLYNDAGVKIYALKISPAPDMTDDEMDYVFNAGAAVGANHVTLEITDDAAFLKRVGGFPRGLGRRQGSGQVLPVLQGRSGLVSRP